MKIGLDIMGGDFAPEVPVKAAVKVEKQLPENTKLILIGDEQKAKEIIAAEKGEADKFDFVNTTEVISMNDHPAKAFAAKKNSSITVGFHLLSQKQIDGFASAGNTGAILVGAMMTVKQIAGIIRPCITAPIPQTNGKTGLLLDVGLNPDCKPEVLYQYGIMGSIFSENIYGIKNPRVGLINIGEEPKKGNLLTKATYEQMKDTKDFNFAGNIEGSDFYNNKKADVFVCDGFVGNIILKGAEAIFPIIKEKKMEDDFFNRFNFETYGGTPVLGINSTVMIGHGVSGEKAIINMIKDTQEVIKADLVAKIRDAFIPKS